MKLVAIGPRPSFVCSLAARREVDRSMPAVRGSVHHHARSMIDASRNRHRAGESIVKQRASLRTALRRASVSRAVFARLDEAHVMIRLNLRAGG
jgi:hypothetical protein